MSLKAKLIETATRELSAVNAQYVKDNKGEFTYSQDAAGNDVGNPKLTLATIGQGSGRFAAAETVKTICGDADNDVVLKFRGSVYLEIVPKKTAKANPKDRF